MSTDAVTIDQYSWKNSRLTQKLRERIQAAFGRNRALQPWPKHLARYADHTVVLSRNHTEFDGLDIGIPASVLWEREEDGPPLPPIPRVRGIVLSEWPGSHSWSQVALGLVGCLEHSCSGHFVGEGDAVYREDKSVCSIRGH